MTGTPGEIVLRPIGWVANARNDLLNDHWGGLVSIISLDPSQFDASAVRGLEEFSHLEVIFSFDRHQESAVCRSARRPRDNAAWPEVGIFAQRASARPNRLAVTRCRLLKVDGLQLTVDGLDAVNGTPVLDVKPYLEEFGPHGTVRQPPWTHEVMKGYY